MFLPKSFLSTIFYLVASGSFTHANEVLEEKVNITLNNTNMFCDFSGFPSLNELICD